MFQKEGHVKMIFTLLSDFFLREECEEALIGRTRTFENEDM